MPIYQVNFQHYDTLYFAKLNNHRSYAVAVKDASNNTLANQEVLYNGSTKGNMQSFRTAQCSAMERGQAQVWNDSRNSQSYRIKKMADGKCWMIDNLRYAYGTLTSSGYLTVDGTSTSGTNYDAAKYADPGTAGASSYCSAGADLSTCYGYLYNWYGATYGTGLSSVSTAGTNVDGNICPNTTAAGSTSATSGGWRLPSSYSDGSAPTTGRLPPTLPTSLASCTSTVPASVRPMETASTTASLCAV